MQFLIRAIIIITKIHFNFYLPLHVLFSFRANFRQHGLHELLSQLMLFGFPQVTHFSYFVFFDKFDLLDLSCASFRSTFSNFLLRRCWFLSESRLFVSLCSVFALSVEHISWIFLRLFLTYAWQCQYFKFSLLLFRLASSFNFYSFPELKDYLYSGFHK